MKIRSKSRAARKTSKRQPLTRSFQLLVLGLNSLALLLVAMVAQATSSHSAVTAEAQKIVLSGQVRDARAAVACAAGLDPAVALNQLNTALSQEDGLTITLGNRPDGQAEQRHIAKPFALSQPTVFPDRNGNTYVCVSVSKN